jgi:tRNA pseudouridine13 synthase
MLSFLTTQYAGIGGVIKTRIEDFFVEELPVCQPSGEGTHVYISIEKREISTMDALAAIARALEIRRQDIGYAGQKDARAVARQWISVEHVKIEKLQGLLIPKVKMLEFARHDNKLKIGQLAGNRFVIRLRKLQRPIAEAGKIAKDVLEILGKRGVPNFFGAQRFGNRSDSHLLGLAIIKGKTEEFADLLLGRPDDGEHPVFSEARVLYENGDYKGAFKKWPYSFADQRRALKALIETDGNKRKAYNVVDKNLKKFFVSAYQSEIFNQVLTARMPDIDKLLTGDMAYKHISGAMFKVEDEALEQPRCEAFEISPTGPLIGGRMAGLTGPAGEIENRILSKAQLEKKDLEQLGNYVRGGRRPLRFGPRNCAVSSGTDDLGQYLELKFELDSGSYATTLLREISKNDPASPEGYAVASRK